MKILVYGINYSPELTGIGKYTGEMCEWFAARGHQVEVITAMPYYPEWEIHEKYKGRWWHSETIKGVKVLRTPFYVPKKVTAFTRITHELSFIFSSSIFWLPRFFKSYDIIIAICPPMQTAVFPLWYKLIRRKPVVFHVQDLQVDAARELGLIKNKFALSILEKIERFIMKKSSFVSTISHGMKARVIKKGISENKIFLLSNWVDTENIKPLDRPSKLKSKLGFKESDKVVLYSGNMGHKQGLEMVINIAERLKSNASLFFVFCGEGASKEKLQEMVRVKELANVRFIGLQPYDQLSDLLGMANLHLVIQKKEASDLVFPSKLISILSAGGVALVTTEEGTGLYQFVKSNNLAIQVLPENEDELLNSLVENINKDNRVINHNARRFAEEELNIHRILENLEKALIQLIRK